jgi:hypothetical protein
MERNQFIEIILKQVCTLYNYQIEFIVKKVESILSVVIKALDMLLDI